MRVSSDAQAASYVSDEAAALTESEAVRNAVVQRIDYLDANFLLALGGFIQVQRRGKDVVCWFAWQLTQVCVGLLKGCHQAWGPEQL